MLMLMTPQLVKNNLHGVVNSNVSFSNALISLTRKRKKMNLSKTKNHTTLMKKALVQVLEVVQAPLAIWKIQTWWKMKTWARLNNKKSARSVKRMRWNSNAVFWSPVVTETSTKMYSLQFTTMASSTTVASLWTRTLQPLIAASLQRVLFVSSLISSFLKLWAAVCAWTATTAVRWVLVLHAPCSTSTILRATRITTMSSQRKSPNSTFPKAKEVCFLATWFTITSRLQTHWFSQLNKMIRTTEIALI